MKNKKATFITIIVLLSIFTPLTVASFFLKGNVVMERNPNHKMYHEGYIWFYDKKDELINRYQCLTEVCELAKGNINDDNYYIKYYTGGEDTTTSVINNRYAFIQDGDIIHLFDIKTANTISEFTDLKNYNIENSNNSFILKDTNDLVGVIAIEDDEVKNVLPFEYEFIGIANNLTEEGLLRTDKFTVKKDNTWYVVDDTNNALTITFENPVVYYNDKYVFTFYDQEYSVFNYEGKEYLENYSIKRVYAENDYMIFITDNNILVYDNLDSNYILSHSLIDTNREVSVERNDSSIDILLDGNIIKSLEL